MPVLIILLVLAWLLQPGWLLRAVALPAWLGGFWRAWLPLLGVAPALVLLLANSLSPGASTAALKRGVQGARGWFPTVVALGVAYLVVLLTAGAVSASRLALSVALFALQLALYPGTPWLLALSVGTVCLLLLDRVGIRGLDVLSRWWPPVGSSLARTARPLAAPLLTAALAGAFAAALFPDAMRGWARAEPTDAQSFNLYRAFFNYSIYEDDRLERRTGFGLGLRGLTLAPGQEGEVVVRLDRPATSIVLLRTDFYNRRLAETGTALTDETFPNRLELSTGSSGVYRTLVENTSLGEIVGGRVLDLTGVLSDARSYRLRFTARNTTAGEVTVLPSFSVSTVVDPDAVPHPAFPVIAYASVAAGAVCTLVYVSARAAPSVVAGSTAGAGLALLAWLASWAALSAGDGGRAGATGLTFDPSNPLDVEYSLRAARAATVVLAGGMLLWMCQPLLRRVRGEARLLSAPALILVVSAIVATVAIDARWQELMRVRYELLLPDAAGYQAIGAEFPVKMARYRSERPSELLEALYDSGYDGRANAAAVFYAGGNNGREPGWPAVLRLTYNLLGVSGFHTRLTSLLIASLCAGVTCWFGWRALHPVVGVTGGLLYALNHPQIVNSAGGLREEAVSLCFLLLISALFISRRQRRPSAARLVTVGAAGGSLILVRADMLVLAGLVVSLAALALRWRIREWLLAGAVCGLLSGPMYVGYAFTHRDPFHPGTYGATVNRNLEFPERMGTPGFPTAEEYAANWAAGPRISPMTYFFGYHSVPQFVEYSVKGFVRIFPTILFRDQPITLWLFVLGMALLLARRRWLVPFVVVICLAPFYAFMAGVPNPWVFAPRYAHHALPFAVLAAAHGAWFLPLWLFTRWALRDTPDSPQLRISSMRTASS